MTKTLKELELEHPEWCFTCGKYWLEPGGIHTCHESPLMAAITAAKREDEARIEELEADRDFHKECHEALAAQEDSLVRLVPSPGMDVPGYIEQLKAQLTAEQQAHAETKRQLEEADKALISEVQDPTYLTDQALPAWEAALARQASINRPIDKSPTDDRGEGEK